MIFLDYLIQTCKKYLGEEETNKIINQAVEEFKNSIITEELKKENNDEK